MPSGGIAPISVIMGAVFHRRDQVRRALDIGVGFGKYGLLLREYLELWDGRETMRKHDWLRRIDGIEVEEAYIQPHHRFLYSNVYIGEALTLMKKMPARSYDLTLVSDVLEHFKKPQGFELLREGLRVADWVLVSVPEDVVVDKITRSNILRKPWNNKYEMHRSRWGAEDLRQVTSEVELLPCEGYIVASLGTPPGVTLD